MKKKMRRPAALLVVVMLMVSMLSVGTFAEGEAGETSGEVISEEETGGATEEAAAEASAAEEASSDSEEETVTEIDAEEAQAAAEEVVEETAAAEEASSDSEEETGTETDAEETLADAEEVQTDADEAQTESEEAVEEASASEGVIEEASAADTEAETVSVSEEVIEEASAAEEAADAAALEEAEASDEALATDTSSYLSIVESSKTITVTNDGSVTSEIQDAIDYIEESASDKTGWTILVYQGLYSTYTVPDDVSVTVKAQSSTQLVAVSDDIGFEVDQTGISVDASSKTVTVSDADDETYEIQNAIDYISTQSDVTGWTIVVGSGTYSRFVVYDGLDNLTIKAADGAEVTVNVLDGSEMQIIDYTFISNKGALSYYYYDANNIADNTIKDSTIGYRGSHWQQGYYDNDGVVLMDVDGLTISGLTFQVGTTTTGLYPSAISTYQSAADSLCPNGFTIDSCTFTGSGYDITDVTSADISYGIFVCTAASEASNWTVSNCTFTNLYCGVEIMNDNNWVGMVSITNNYFEGCDRAVDGYFGNSREVLAQSDWGTFTFTGNTLIGDSDEYCKVLLGDDVSTWTSDDYYKRNYDAFGYVTLSGNTLSYAEFIIFGIEDEQLGYADLLETNTYTTCAFVLEGSESTYSAEINFVMDFESDEEDSGYWAYLSNSSITSYYYVGRGWTDAEYAIVVAAIEKANASGSHTLILDFSSLYDSDSGTYDSGYSAGNSWEWTVVCLKYGIRWVSTSGEEPDVEKSVTSDSAVEAGDTVDFSLTVSAPEYLDAYMLDEDTDGIENKMDSYVVTVHDTMDSVLTLDADSIKVSVDGVFIDSYRYTLTASDLEDGCTFELSIDLVSLVEAGILTADSDGAYPDVVITYTATVAEGTAAGTYENTAWVTYEADGISEKSTVEIEVQKYLKIAVTKAWDDSDDADGLRPDSVTIELYADGSATGLTLTLSEENEWTASFTDLPAYTFDADGNTVEIVYTVAESGVDGYTASYSDLTGSIEEGYAVTVTNVHEVTEEEVPEEETPEEETPEDTGDTEETPEEEESEDTEETLEEEETEDTEDTEETEEVEETEETEEIEDDEDAEESEDAEDDEDAEEVEDVEATDTGDPGVTLWITVLCTALASILIRRKKIAG